MSISAVVNAAADLCGQRTPLNNLIEIAEKETCAELPIGKSNIVNFDRNNSPTSVSHKYELTRISPDKYKIRLNLRLQENTLRARENTDLTKKMRSKIEKCLEWINPHLLGPDNKKLEIELIDNSSESSAKKYREIENWVSVSEEKISRHNSGFYSLQTSCPVIAHELLHLLGLVDEYREPIKMSWYEQECRSFGPPDSIMANHNEATDFSDEFPQKMVISCCICKNNKCLKNANRDVRSLKTCPSGYDTINSYAKRSKEGETTGQALNQIYCTSLGSGFTGMSGSKDSGSNDSFLLSSRPSKRIEGSFLYPAHFRAIVAPGCKEKNKLYYSCSRDAYFRPYKLIGSCSARPVQCQSEDEWLQ